jgi:hypothetical protein
MSVPLKATVQAIEGDSVRLTLEDGQTLRLPIQHIEGTPKPGAAVCLIAAIPGSEDASRQAMAQHLLNLLLGTTSSAAAASEPHARNHP